MLPGVLTRKITFLLLMILLWGTGVAFGAYYHQEIAVWVGTLLHPNLSTQTPIIEPALVAALPRLEMKTLDSPLPLIESETLEESRIQDYLKQGAVILPLGTSFGQPGNMVVTAHSSGTTGFGPYRFAFAKLSELQSGEEFKVITKDGTYTYQVFGSEVVWPHEVDKLPNDDRSTVTLVTCWPLWTNFKRLLVHGELVNVAYN